MPGEKDEPVSVHVARKRREARARAQRRPDPAPRRFGLTVMEAGRAWQKVMGGRSPLRHVLAGFKEETAELRVFLRDEHLPGIENALGSLTEAVEENTAMMERVETAIMELPGWGVKKVHVPGCGVMDAGKGK